MVRTKADGAGRRAVGAKAPRKQVGGGSSSAASSFGSPTSSGNKNKYNGGNPVKWWPSPKWQKGIGDFFPKDSTSSEVSPEKPGPSVANECPGTSSEAQGIEGIEEIVED
ncbi:PCNA-associated factor-like [Orbicella faveolata]|uniref:PCNA-associated factor-like n=1 Tax=Orbicella faveolata TaxID=48498 RepID=UPI0009E3498F|nr:PCNA-associated factor-like [Orbicella faveolata]